MLLNGDSTLLIVLPTVFIVVLAPVITISLVHVRYKKFVERWSVGLKTLKKINDSYRFKPVSNLNMYHSYDNENMFGDISCTDYLTYQLVYEQEKVLQRIKEANRNRILFERYSEEIARDLSFGVYSTEKALMMKKYLSKVEKRMISEMIKNPNRDFKISITLTLTTINGEPRCRKSETFNSIQIERIIERLWERDGTFYLNRDIWDSICRVERGKVTNKMRFLIYARDDYRCQICHRKTKDLEIDHIIPIAKGGKSTIDNLQTLCHRCNVEKGTKLFLR